MMLSLRSDWNYTTRGLAKICKEGTHSIGSALKKLERAGYIVRNRLRDSKGKIVDLCAGPYAGEYNLRWQSQNLRLSRRLE